MLNIDEIKTEVQRLNEVIGAPQSLLPTFGHRNEAWPAVEVDKWGYHYVISERGEENRTMTGNLDDLFYMIFADVVGFLSFSQCQTLTTPDQDSRRVLFAFQVNTLSRLSPDWGAKKQQEFDEVLAAYPFDDFQDARNRRIRQLEARGNSYEDADVLASQEYPRP